ncbi:hypothetical protein BX616_006579, partial [Lobosporangium transversale]
MVTLPCIRFSRVFSSLHDQVPSIWGHLDTLRLAIEKVTRIPQGSQILMTSEGLQLKPDMMFEVITSTDK